MATTYVKDMGEMPVSESFNRKFYISKVFKYEQIMQYDQEEHRILSDISKIELDNVDFSGRANVWIKRNPCSKVISHQTLEQIMTLISDKLVMQSDIVWCDEEDDKFKPRELEIEINLPAKNVSQGGFRARS